MLNQEDVISLYEDVSALTTQMLDAARRGDWDHLVELENRCASQVDRLREGEAPVPLTGAWRETKIRIIKQILDQDRQIRDIVEPWMAELAALINSTGTERKLSQAYGVSAG